MVPSMYSLMWLAEFVTPDSLFKHLIPHLDATGREVSIQNRVLAVAVN